MRPITCVLVGTGTPALKHEVGDNPMKREAIEVPGCSEPREASGLRRGFLDQKSNRDLSPSLHFQNHTRTG